VLKGFPNGSIYLMQNQREGDSMLEEIPMAEGGLEEPTRPATRPIAPERPTNRADHLWLASPGGLVQIGSELPNEDWHPEVTKLASLLGPHYRVGDEATFEISNGYAVACVATAKGWLLAVGHRGQESRDLRRDALAMARFASRLDLDDSAKEAPVRATVGEFEHILARHITFDEGEVSLAQRLWGEAGPFLLSSDGSFQLMTHVATDAPLGDVADQWGVFAHRFRLATGRVLPGLDALLATGSNKQSTYRQTA
jgi:hypothetical protein